MSSSRAWIYAALLLVSLSLCSVIIGANGQITDPAEVRALREIRRSLVDVNGNLSNWNRGDPCTSNWTGVFCHNRTLDDGYLHVRELMLLHMNLSGTLSPELGRLTHMEILDFMWNSINGSIPKEIGNITSLKLMLLNGNQLTGSLPEEIGNLKKLDRIQIDQNHISGPIPTSFANLENVVHFHMNNNSISGQIPPELARLPKLVHLLLDNNNLSGYLPRELSEMPELLILQLDNNNFEGSTIPDTYSNMSKLLKLSLRNCSLQGPMPDLSRIPSLAYLDLSANQLNGSIPPGQLSSDMTTINLANNNLTGNIPASFSQLPRLQTLLIANNSLDGSISSSIWESRILNATERLILNFENNRLSNLLGRTDLPPNVTVWLQGNPLCSSNASLVALCGSQRDDDSDHQRSPNSVLNCPPQACPHPYEYSRTSPDRCFCAAPLLVGYRLKSPGFSYFHSYKNMFEQYLTSGLRLHHFQLDIDSFMWQKGPRLRMHLKIYPVYDANNRSNVFNGSEVRRIRWLFTSWNIPDSEVFGPYELLNFTLLDPYKDVFPPESSQSGISKGVLAGIVLGCIAGAVLLSTIVSLLIFRARLKNYRPIAKRRQSSKSLVKIDGVRSFTYNDLATATNHFDSSVQVGQGGYGRVYRGILVDGTAVAIKRAQEGSLQGEKEFLTEIEFLSRLHHRNLVSLVGYCDEEGEQLLVYEYMSKGTLRDHLSAKSKEPLSFAMRVKVALAAAKGILYLHTEADPPIFHRDIKASNILLDSNYTAKVADFGLSRLAPVPDVEGMVPNHVSTVVKGTPGYLDPEYFLTHKLTDKSDVYSLGVVFLELLTGMQPISHGKNIVREANMAYQSGTIFTVIDERMGSYPSECVEKFVTLALKCCQEETDARPSMAEVVRTLESIWLMMPEPECRTTTDFSSSDVNSEVTPPSSMAAMRNNPFVSLDVSGSNLVSGVVPSIRPR